MTTISFVLSRPINAPSGFPQGNHLGPFSFACPSMILIPCQLDSSFLVFADDLKIFREITSLDQQIRLLNDLERIIRTGVVKSL